MSELSAEREVELLRTLVRVLGERGLLLRSQAGETASSIRLAQGAGLEAVAEATRLGLPIVSRSRVLAEVATGRGVALVARSWRPVDVAVVLAQVVASLDAALAAGDRVLGVDPRPATSWVEFAELALDPARPLGGPFVSLFDPLGSRLLAEFEAGEFGSVPVPSCPMVETFAGLLVSALVEESAPSTVWVSRQAAPLMGALTRLAFEKAFLLESAKALEGVQRVSVSAPRRGVLGFRSR